MPSPRHLLLFQPTRVLRASHTQHLRKPSLNLTILSRRTCLQQRCYASSKPSLSPKGAAAAAAADKGNNKVEEELKRLAMEAAWRRKDDTRLVNVLVYHAGTARTTFLALLKVTSLFVGAFFCGIVVPAYVTSEKPYVDTVQMLACGLIPPVFVAMSTAAFVTHIHVRVPQRLVSQGQASLINAAAAAGRSRKGLASGGDSVLPPDTIVVLTTMSLIAKPRRTALPLRELKPSVRRFGLVNYVREQPAASAAEDAAKRKWYHWRPVKQFYVQAVRPVKKVRYEAPKKDMVQRWLWAHIQERLEKGNIS
jgi:hypothetical protein